MHRDANECQRQEFWETGIAYQLESGPIQERRVHIQEMTRGWSAFSSTDARRESRSHRMESIQSATSTSMGKPTFGSSIVACEGDKAQENMDSSSSSGMDIPSLYMHLQIVSAIRQKWGPPLHGLLKLCEENFKNPKRRLRGPI